MDPLVIRLEKHIRQKSKNEKEFKLHLDTFSKDDIIEIVTLSFI